jgi:CRP-like cAMP-binding protein
MNDIPVVPIRNSILSALSQNELTAILPALERIDLPRGKVLHQPGEQIQYVYFPEGAMISVVAYTEEGQGAEVAVIGSEGATGLDIVLGSDSTSNEHITQMADGAFRMKTEVVRDQFHLCGHFHDLLLQFTRKLIVQISQTALCNRLHTTEKRLSRWLLMSHDRAESDVLNLTQEFISVMLGSNRTTVTMTAIELQNQGFISYSRGKITIVDRSGLEGFACPCYKIIRTAYAPVA